jgi:selenide, water dikinase
VLEGLTRDPSPNPNLIVGLDRADDAGVYRLTDEIALVQTVDFFTPIVDDPRTFGAIAAANALSDVWAMGGRPICALHIACFPSRTMDLSVLTEVMNGSLDKLREADVALAGGHTVDDPEIKFGLSVTGTVHPGRVLRKTGARAGDALLLTKPLGTGVVAQAAKKGRASPAALERAVASMCALNRLGAEVLLEGEVHALTDVTGFGLLGHACEMLEGTGLSFEIEARAVPILPEALAYAEAGLVPGGLARNRAHRSAQVVPVGTGLAPALLDLLFDPQTSGGLLAAVPAARVEETLERMRSGGLEQASRVGRVVVASPTARDGQILLS